MAAPLALILIAASLLAGRSDPAPAREAAAVRLHCARHLHWHLFEDRSGRLDCGRHVLVRVSVPG